MAYGSGPETTKQKRQRYLGTITADVLRYEGQMMCQYSTQTDPRHAQQLVHKTANNLVNGPDEAYMAFSFKGL